MFACAGADGGSAGAGPGARTRQLRAADVGPAARGGGADGTGHPAVRHVQGNLYTVPSYQI